MSAQNSQIITADSLYLLGNYTKAINEYSKIGNQKSKLQIARAYHALGNSGKAIVQYLDIVHKEDNVVQAKFELGKLYDKLKKYEEAKEIFEQLVDLETENPEFLYYLGKNQLSLLENESAVSSLEKAISLDETHIKSIFLLGKQYLKEQRIAEALNVIEIGLKSAENDVALINLKALAHFNNDSHEEAAPLFYKLIELGEEKPFIYEKLGFSELTNWNFDPAKHAYRSLGEFPGKEADAYKGLGRVYLKEQKLDSAEIYFTKSIKERRYIFDEEYRDLGRIARLKGQLKKALDLYTKAWEENKVNFYAYFQVCVMADEYYEDPETRLVYYEKLTDDFKNLPPFLKERAQKRISELKEEIHLAKE